MSRAWIAVVIVIVGGCGRSMPAGAPVSSADTTTTPLEATTTVAETTTTTPMPRGQTPEQALADTLAGLSPDAFASAAYGDPPIPDQRWYSDSDLWLHVQAQPVPGDGTPPVEQSWEATLLLGAVTNRTTTTTDPTTVVAGLVKYVLGSDGTFVADVIEPANESIAAGQRFVAPGDDATSRQLAMDVVANYGLEPVEVAVLHPLDAALKVVAVVSTPEAMHGALAQIHRTLEGSPAQYEGVYLEIRLPDGTPIAKVANAARTGMVTQWFVPEFEHLIGSYPHSTVPEADEG